MFLARSTSETALLLRPMLVRNVSTSSRLFYAKDDDNSSSDDEKRQKKPKQPKQAAKQQEESAASRLNRLLASMPADDNSILSKSINMAKPGEAHKKRKEASKEQTATKDVFAAAKRVAEMLGEDNKKQTESELLAKLMGHKQDVDSSINMQEKSAKNESSEAELSLSDLISGMKIDRRQQPKEETRSEFVRRTLVGKSQQQQSQQRKSDAKSRYNNRAVQKREAEHFTGSVNLFGGEALNIFKDPTKLHTSPDMLRTWAYLQKRELELQVSRPPENYFEKLALWTEQGKLWKFPIDNEQDMQEEANVDFSEHIFLEQHLEPWCPNKGPIRHFMELVCVGLSKNPYISAKDKKEHILWYRDYFEEKKEILKDYMKSDKNMKKLNEGEKQLEA